MFVNKIISIISALILLIDVSIGSGVFKKDSLSYDSSPVNISTGYGAGIKYHTTIGFNGSGSSASYFEDRAYFPLPYYETNVELDRSRAVFSLKAIKTRMASTWETKLIDSYKLNIPSEFELLQENLDFRGQTIANILIFPVRKSGNAYEFLLDFELEGEVLENSIAGFSTQSAQSTQNAQEGSQNNTLRNKQFGFSPKEGEPQDSASQDTVAKEGRSFLSYGKSLKISVELSGVYKVSYEDLLRNGILAQAVESSKIALYGREAGMLPGINYTSYKWGLQIMPIYMHDGGDGIFGPSDYFLFYGQSPIVLEMDNNGLLTHQNNSYSNKSYYFVGANHKGENKRIEKRPSQITSNSKATLSSFPDFVVYEKDLENIAISGQAFYGEGFSTSGDALNFNLSLLDISPDALPNQSHNTAVRIHTAALTQTGTASFSISGSIKGSISLSATANVNAQLGRNLSMGKFTDYVNHNSTNFQVGLSYNKTSGALKGYLDFIAINYSRSLKLNRGSLLFRYPNAKEVYTFSLSGTNSSTMVWDVSNPYDVYIQESEISGSTASFKSGGDSINHTWIAFDGTVLGSPSIVGVVEAVDLLSYEGVDYVAVSPNDFKLYADSIALLHAERDGYSVYSVVDSLIYDEFAAGIPDPSAIRLFMKTLYNNALNGEGVMPKYLLLFGKASFDSKNRLGRSNFIPTFEVSHAQNDENIATDDGFAYMGDDEGLHSEYGSASYKREGLMDIAVGRLPVSSLDQARDMYAKIERYTSPYKITLDKNLGGATDAMSNFGEWRNEISFSTDDDFEYLYERNINYTKLINNTNPNINIQKIYADSYKKAANAVNAEYPQANADLKNRMNKGALFVGYMGHSSWEAWGDEKYLTLDDVYNWKPILSHPIMVSSSCSYLLFDQIDKTSAGEVTVLLPNSGAISMFAASRSATVGTIEYAQRDFLLTILNKKSTLDSNRVATIGDASLYAKDNNRNRSGIAMFVLMGDPGLRPALPKYEVKTLEINSKDVASADVPDTIKAYSTVTIKGEISNGSERVENFNGHLQIKIFDKPSFKKTLGNSQSRGGYNDIVEYQVQKNLIYKGSTEVKNGEFSFVFIVPKDISYNFGNGKLSYYAYSDSCGDASGSFTDIIVGGFNSNIEVDTVAPVVELFINKDNFIAGSYSGAEPILYAKISDKYGLNTTGVGIGHDISLIVDGDNKNPIILTDFFNYDPNSYTSGYLNYPLSLSEGYHHLEVKAWNIFNVSGTGEIDFGVDSSDKFKITSFRAAPNPVSKDGILSFGFVHNGVGEIEKYTILIYDQMGKKIASIEGEEFSSFGYSVGPLKWEISKSERAAVQRGIYLARLVAYNKNGDKDTATCKFVVGR